LSSSHHLGTSSAELWVKNPPAALASSLAQVKR
jgi:hypothetical protein